MNRPIATFKMTSAGGHTNGTFEVFKRTFEAKKFPIGSKERAELNLDAVTSEYMVSYKFAIIGHKFSTSKRTKVEAIDTAKNLAGL